MEVGVDIEEVGRFKESYKDDHFIRLIFTDREIDYCNKKKEPYISFAGKFCAKEAVVKAYDQKLTMKEIEVINDSSGKVKIFIKGQEDDMIKCSISHTKDYAVSFVVVK